MIIWLLYCYRKNSKILNVENYVICTQMSWNLVLILPFFFFFLFITISCNLILTCTQISPAYFVWHCIPFIVHGSKTDDPGMHNVECRRQWYLILSYFVNDSFICYFPLNNFDCRMILKLLPWLKNCWKLVFDQQCKMMVGTLSTGDLTRRFIIWSCLFNKCVEHIPVSFFCFLVG